MDKKNFLPLVLLIAATSVLSFLYLSHLEALGVNLENLGDYKPTFSLVPSQFTVPLLLNRLAELPYAVFTWVSYQFLHAGYLHLVLNLVGLFCWGYVVVQITGREWFAPVYVLCGMAAGLCSILWNPLSIVPIVGASGSVMGLLGIFSAFVMKGKIPLSVPFFFILAALTLIMLGSTAMDFISEMMTGLPSEAAYEVHFFGYLAGIAIGAFWRSENVRIL